MHEKARLGLLTSLMAHPKGLAFGDLKQLCGLTDGNLSRHLLVLHEAGLVEITKGYEGNRPHTTCRLTKTGRRRFLDYLAVLEKLVRDAAKAAGEADNLPSPGSGRPAPELSPFLQGSFAMQSRRPDKPRADKLHVGVIMDGNGRWATRRGLPRLPGTRRASKQSGG